MSAHLAQINLSDGGVPKRPVQIATITPLGLLGDRQAPRKSMVGQNVQYACIAWNASWPYRRRDSRRPGGKPHPVGPGLGSGNPRGAASHWGSGHPGSHALCLPL